MDRLLRSRRRQAVSDGPLAMYSYQRSLCRVGTHDPEIRERKSDCSFNERMFQVTSWSEMQCSLCETDLGESEKAPSEWLPCYPKSVDEAFPGGLEVPEDDRDRFHRETWIDVSKGVFWYPQRWVSGGLLEDGSLVYGVGPDGFMPHSYWEAWCSATEEREGFNPNDSEELRGAMYSNPNLLRLATRWKKRHGGKK